MKWLDKLFGVSIKAEPSYEELDDILLNTEEPHWELEGPKTFKELFGALKNWLPEGSVLYFEDGSPSKELNNFFTTHPIPEKDQKRIPGGSYGRPKISHAPATGMVLTELVGMMKHHAGPELAIHFHVYKGERILLQWYDAGDNLILISGIIPEQQIKVLAERIGTKYKIIA